MDLLSRGAAVFKALVFLCFIRSSQGIYIYIYSDLDITGSSIQFFSFLSPQVAHIYITQAAEFAGGDLNLPPLVKASRFQSEAYDYIIVGGGTAGCPLAATLSHKYKVLLLERGGSPYGNRNITLLENFHICLADVSPQSPSQAFISTDGVINARANVLGGGTCINAGFYSRAKPRYVRILLLLLLLLHLHAE